MDFGTFKKCSTVKTTETQSKNNKNTKRVFVEHTLKIGNTEFTFTSKQVYSEVGKKVASMRFFKINGKGVCKRAFNEILETF